MERNEGRPGKEELVGGGTGNSNFQADGINSPSPGQTSDPTQDPEASELTTPEQEAERESEKRVKELLGAYQDTIDYVERLPVVVWVPWDRKRPGSYFKVPYMRWFLKYFVSYHVGNSLNALNRRFHAVAALSDNPDSNRANREMVKLYLQSLPRVPVRLLIFIAVLAALVVALPLQAFGNVFYVLDLVGAMLRSDVGYVGKALDGNKLGPTLRSLTVLLIGLIVVAGVTTSPFGLKRILFNLHPWTGEHLGSTAARSHGYRSVGLYALEDRVFEEAGIRRPHEGRWDLAFQTFLLAVLLLFGLCMALLTLVVLVAGEINLNLDTEAPSDFKFYAPEVWWGYYALFTGLVLAACVFLLKRLVAAWRQRA